MVGMMLLMSWIRRMAGRLLRKGEMVLLGARLEGRALDGGELRGVWNTKYKERIRDKHKEVFMYNFFLVRSLNKCKDENDIEAAFDKFGKKDYQIKMDYLNKCRGNPVTFFTGSGGSDNEAELRSKYLTVRSMFLTGSWS
jgi:hypothetical protein